MASLWQKQGGMWCVTFWHNGKQHVRSLRTKSKRQALRLKLAIETNLAEQGAVSIRIDGSEAPEPKNPTYESFWTAFQDWAAFHRSRAAVDEYKEWFFRFQRFSKFTRLGDVTRPQVEAFKRSLCLQGKRKPKGVGLSQVSINNALKVLQAIWNHAEKLELYNGHNPFRGVERFQTPVNYERDYLVKEQIDQLLATAKDRINQRYIKEAEAVNVYLAIALMALAGLRKREACFARWEWIDWNERVIKVANDNGFVTKNKRPRIISMSAQLIDVIEPFKVAEGYILKSVRATNGKTNYRVDFDNGFRSVCAQAGIETTPHQLRHSFASRHAVAGTSLHVIAGWLGHSTTWVTQRYAHFQKTFNAAADNI